jgi:UDP-N-acetylmuramoyl-L-alanyl-D-glutamate--2,6-diaminopimelate ligase
MEKFTLKQYIDELKKYNQIKNLEEIDKLGNVLKDTIQSITYNSKEVEDNSLFVCKGVSFKEEYLKEAIGFGAKFYISENKYNVQIPCVLVENIYISLCIIGGMYYNYANEKLNVIGITGTKGKSTTSYYIKYILDEYMSANFKKNIAIISSIDTYDGVENFESHLTTPESLDLHRHFFNAKTSGIENLVMEVSSQALKYGRVFNVGFDIGLFLNISEDHISPIEHSDLEDYFTSKLKIFEKSKIACINLDSDMIDRVIEASKNGPKKVITFSMKNGKADIYAYNVHKVGFNTLFNVRTPNYDREFELTMPGIFNVENALAAISVAYVMNIPDKYIYIGLKKAKSSGRMEVYHSEDEKIMAIVDYAHNKLSFQKLYESTKSEYPDRKIITVFGCPGKKAYLRRRDLGTLAGQNSDKIYLTAEDPGYEPVEQISNDIAQYVKQYTNNYELIEDRGEAIKAAIETAAADTSKTVILITGKGNETRQKYGSEYLPCKTDVEYSTIYLKEYDEKKKAEEIK